VRSVGDRRCRRRGVPGRHSAAAAQAGFDELEFTELIWQIGSVSGGDNLSGLVLAQMGLRGNRVGLTGLVSAVDMEWHEVAADWPDDARPAGGCVHRSRGYRWGSSAGIHAASAARMVFVQVSSATCGLEGCPSGPAFRP